ncbi:MAG: hypothetical protein K6T85_17035, partial [Gorillibacterium sp.]|nr:hypothetical protein [Gorillibacterium sp.]
SHTQGKGQIHAAQDYSEVTTLLGITVDELKLALKSGKSLADLAGEQGIEVQKLIDLETKTLTAKLDQQLKDEKITQEQYDSRKAAIATSASEIVKGIYSNKGVKNNLGNKAGQGVQGLYQFKAVVLTNTDIASLLGLTVTELSTQLKAGKSLAVIAGEKNVTVQSVIALEEKAITAALDKQLTAGTITQAQYDTWKTSVTKWVTAIVNDTHLSKGKGMEAHGGFGPMMIMDNADLAKLLVMTTVELKAALHEGKSLATLASENNVTLAVITTQVTKILTAELDKKLADGVITQVQYTEATAKLSAKATELVNGTCMTKEDMKGMKDRKGMDGKGEGGPGRHGGMNGVQK